MRLSIPEGLKLVAARAGANRSLAVLVTTRPDRVDPQVALVNAAPFTHPVTGDPTVAFVGRPGAKLESLRLNPRATLVFQDGWEWVAVKGEVELSGPDDANPNFVGETQRQLLRDIFHAAGGSHDDLDSYDDAMLEDRRCAVLVTPDHIWTNPPASVHKEDPS
ncbi:MAG: pyridoxamine 5'-phosphate oxidase family protein [Acidimicrobiales bacterium]